MYAKWSQLLDKISNGSTQTQFLRESLLPSELNLMSKESNIYIHLCILILQVHNRVT